MVGGGDGWLGEKNENGHVGEKNEKHSALDRLKTIKYGVRTE